jgi:undecaprenyl-diphosphatase
MTELVDFIARHAVSVLLIVAFVWLLITAAFWHVVQRYEPRLRLLASQTWRKWSATSLAHRLRRLPIVGSLAGRTMTVLRRLGLYAIIGFAFAAGALVSFFELADEIGVDESLAQFDEQLAAALGRHLSYETLRVFSVVTMLGDREVLIVIATLVAVALLLMRRWVLAGAWVVATAAGGLLNVLLKELFERPRPLHDHGLVTETSFSFPSGHASGSMLIYSLLGYLIVRHTPKAWHIPTAVAMVAIIIFVGSSRVILQVHYFSDVLAGYASAAAWVALCIAGLEVILRRGVR